MTSARHAGVARHAVAQGVVLYLLKPFTFAGLADRHQRYGGSGRPEVEYSWR